MCRHTLGLRTGGFDGVAEPDVVVVAEEGGVGKGSKVCTVMVCLDSTLVDVDIANRERGRPTPARERSLRHSLEKRVW